VLRNHYVCSWLALDLASSVPIDLIDVLRASQDAGVAITEAGGMNPDSQGVGVMKVLITRNIQL
jgi:hypothetical protein